MKNKKITDENIPRLPLAKKGQSSKTYWCRSPRWLGVRCHVSKRSFVARIDHKGKTIMRVIGDAPELGMEEAIRRGAIFRADVMNGIAPEVAKAQNEADALTLRQSLEWHIEKSGVRAASKTHYLSHLDRHLSDWADKPIKSITHGMCLERHEKVTGAVSGVSADVVIRVVRIAWGAAERRYRDYPWPKNPGTFDKDQWHGTPVRKDYIKEEEFRRYEDASLRYTGIESHEGLTHYGLYNTVIARE